MHQSKQKISHKEMTTLSSIFKDRAFYSAQKIAYKQYDTESKTWQEYSWQSIAADIGRWQATLLKDGLKSGDKIAIMVSNSREWVTADQAALGLGLIVVPLYINDRVDNISYIINDAEIQCLLIENNAQLKLLTPIKNQLEKLKRVICIKPLGQNKNIFNNIVSLDEWLIKEESEFISIETSPDSLATIVYTSGTTGNPKGVMLSHRNILNNIYSGLSLVDVYSDDVFLSFLPLSHMLERTAGYYIAVVCGSTVAFSRSIPLLGEDLITIKPTVMISVPRIFERVYTKIKDKLAKESKFKNILFNIAIKLGWMKFQVTQRKRFWSPVLLFHPLLDKLVSEKVRQKMGGQLRFTICGGASLSEDIAQFFIGLGIPILQGYGLTETSPVIAVNTLENNVPKSVGMALDNIEVRISENNELLTRSDSVMLGYWHNEEASMEMIDQDGWLHTGDKAEIIDEHIFITGRIKDIIVLSNGEKVSPTDMELAISLSTLIEQVIIIGEAKPFLSAIVVTNKNTPSSDNLNKDVKKVIDQALQGFPGYAKIRQFRISDTAWTIENGLMTPTMKLKRAKIEALHASLIEDMYRGH